MERVTVIRGDKPLLIIAPHGKDDSGTSTIAQIIAKELGCYCVTNNGWRRSEKVDAIKGEANCNSIAHCHQEVVKDEFLFPIFGFAKRMIMNHGYGNVFIIHGMGRNDPDVFLGYGDGNPASYSCNPLLKDAFIQLCEDNCLSVQAAESGSKYAGRSTNNLNQLFKFYGVASNKFGLPIAQFQSIDCMQLEIASHLRENLNLHNTSMKLAQAMDKLLERNSWVITF